MHKYFHQKYDLWSKYDQGIRMDRESWYSCTPEKIAKQISERCDHFYNKDNRKSNENKTKSVIIDAYCGTGSNAIQFAITHFDYVIAIDINEKKIAMAQWNAQVYGVSDKIEFICGDIFEVMHILQMRFRQSNNEKIQAIYMSPPWGGPAYIDQPVYQIDQIPGILGLMQKCRQLTANIVVYLPRNITIRGTVDLGSSSTEECYCIEYFTPQKWKVKAIAVYFFGDRQLDCSKSEGNENSPHLTSITNEIQKYILKKAVDVQVNKKAQFGYSK